MQGEDLTREQREAAQSDLLRFTALNALSFEVLAGQILILFARNVGASLAEVGLLAALLPFASIIQLGVAPLVKRFGPRKLMLVGWGARTVVSACLLLVPYVAQQGGASRATQMLLTVMGSFYLCRALGMSSWLPLVQEIVPPQDRGMYLSRQEWMRQVSIVIIAVVTAVYLFGATGTTRFLHIIALGTVAAAWSLWYLWKIPDVGFDHDEQEGDYFQRAFSPLRDRGFLQYLAFSVTLRMVLSAIAPFLIVFLREGLHLPASGVIAVNTVSSLGAIATLGWWGRWSDRVGAKPALAVSLCGMAVAMTLWMLTRAGSAAMWVEAGAVSIALGVFTGGLTVSMSKFELGFIPLRDRAHYVAINVTVIGLASGIATLAAGRLLQLLDPVRFQWGLLEVDSYRLFFFIAAVLLVVPLYIRRSLPEARARSLRSLLRRAFVRRSVRVRRLLSQVGPGSRG
jgi:MFS family permease